jgi:hypothetical protein
MEKPSVGKKGQECNLTQQLWHNCNKVLHNMIVHWRRSHLKCIVTKRTLRLQRGVVFPLNFNRLWLKIPTLWIKFVDSGSIWPLLKQAVTLTKQCFFHTNWSTLSMISGSLYFAIPVYHFVTCKSQIGSVKLNPQCFYVFYEFHCQNWNIWKTFVE